MSDALKHGLKSIGQKMQDTPNRMNTLIIVLCLFLVVALILAIYSTVESSESKNETNNLKKKLKSSNSILTDLKNQITTLTGNQRASQEMLNLNQGQRGPPGSQGPVGGVYQDKGYLHSIKHGPNMAVDRYFSNGVNSKAFINTKTFGATSQSWTFTNDGVLENKYEGCLYADDTTNNVYMMNNCKDGTGKGQWISDKKGGKLIWKYKPHKCLAVGGKTRSTTQTIKNGKPVAGQTQYATLRLEKCDQNNPGHQVWTFS